MFKIFPQSKAEGKKPSFDEWLKKANDLLEEYLDEPGLGPLGKAEEKKEENQPKASQPIEEEGDSLAQERIRLSQEQRIKEKKLKKQKEESRQKRLRRGLIFAEILDKPISKRNKRV